MGFSRERDEIPVTGRVDLQPSRSSGQGSELSWVSACEGSENDVRTRPVRDTWHHGNQPIAAHGHEHLAGRLDLFEPGQSRQVENIDAGGCGGPWSKHRELAAVTREMS